LLFVRSSTVRPIGDWKKVSNRLPQHFTSFLYSARP